MMPTSVSTGVKYSKTSPKTKAKSQADALARTEFLHHQFIYVPHMTVLLKPAEAVGLHHSEGLALFSKYPILDSNYFRCC
jgi:hypothetical protein